MHPEPVPVERDRRRFVDRDPVVDPVAEGLRREQRVVAETFGRVPHEPAARVLKLLRRVPVVESHHRADACREQFVEQSVVERDAFAVRTAPAAGLEARPGQREPVRVEAEVGHERDILAVPVVVVVGDRRGAAVGDAPRLRHEGVPRRRPAPALAHGALDLKRGRRGAEDEPGRHAPREGPRLEVVVGAAAIGHGPSTLSRYGFANTRSGSSRFRTARKSPNRG